MKKFNYKNSSVEIDESNETLKINGEDVPIRKTESGYAIFYLTGFKDMESATKAFIETQKTNH